MITENEIVHLGHFGKAHGINGEINLYTDIEAENMDIENLKMVVVNIDGIFVPFQVSSMRNKRYDSYIVQLTDINNEKQSRKLTNLDVFVMKKDNIIQEQSDSDGLYATDLIGYTIISASDGGIIAGKITDVDISTENALFIIKNSSSENTSLIPIVNEMIQDINPETKTIVMQLPEGLLSINNSWETPQYVKTVKQHRP